MIDRLPGMLEQLNSLASIDRFLTSLEESIMFLNTIREVLVSDRTDTSQLSRLATLESRRTYTKVKQERQLCTTYTREFENMVQMAISYNTAAITSRLDGGRDAADRLTKVGVLVGVIACVVSPLGLLTSFYGMNVQEFQPGAGASLFQFWQIGMPVLLLTLIGSALVAVWMLTSLKVS